MKRIVSALLVLLMLAGMLVACQSDLVTDPVGSGSSEGNAQESDSASDVVTEPESIDYSRVDPNGYLLDRLPENLDYGEQEIAILGWNEMKDVAWPTEPSTANPIQDVSYWHWKSVEERLNIAFKMTYSNAAYSHKTTFLTAARAEDAAYDLIHTYSLWQPVLAQEGRLSNLRALNYPDLEMPWWPESTKEYTQNGGLYFLTSNSSMMMIRERYVLFANSRMIEEAGLGDVVKLVLRGSWTIEELARYVKSFAGLAEANPGEIYGLVVEDYTRVDAFYYAAFQNIRSNESTGVAEIVYDNKDTLTQISDYMDQIFTMFRGMEVKTESGSADYSSMVDGETAFLLGSMWEIQNVEDTSVYAAVPVPKLNSAQKQYRSICNNAMDLWSVPIVSMNKEVSGAVLEAIASSEYRTVAPFYYEQYLKRRYSSDADGMKCFDIIRQSMIFDFGRVSYESLGAGNSLEDWWRLCFGLSGEKVLTNSFISYYEGGIGSIRHALDKILQDYQKNNKQ